MGAGLRQGESCGCAQDDRRAVKIP